MNTIEEMCGRAKAAYQILRSLSGKCRAQALDRMAGKVLARREAIFAANAADLAAAPELTPAFRKRLQITDKVFKPNYVGTALAECFVPFPKELLGADALRIESFGLGGEGVCWVELPGGKAKAILAVHGVVEHPENLLDNDVKFAWFGSQNSYDDYMDSNRTSAVHSVELSF